MNILITGVAGLLGSRLADWIIENKPEANVIGVDDLSGGYIENVNDKVTFYNMKVESDEIKELFSKHNIDYVYHFAAYAAEGLSPFIRTFNYINNLVATANIVNQCINYDVKRLVFTSSMAVYGEDNPPFAEELRRNPIDPYGVAKSACERDIEIAGEQHGLDWCIIRPHNVYGKKQNIWDKYRNVLGIWMYQHMNGNPITIFGDGKQTRAFSYIDDVLEPFWKAATDERASREIINLGGIKEYTITEAADILMEVVGGKDIVYLEQRHEVKHAWSTYQKSVELLDYKESIGLKEGLIEMWDWAQNQPNREQKKFDKYEVDKGLYSFWK
jgi:UDP-glucose 4-epimerase